MNNSVEREDKQGKTNKTIIGSRDEASMESYKDGYKGKLITQAPKNHMEVLEIKVTTQEEAQQEIHTGGDAVREGKG